MRTRRAPGGRPRALGVYVSPEALRALEAAGVRGLTRETLGQLLESVALRSVVATIDARLLAHRPPAIRAGSPADDAWVAGQLAKREAWFARIAAVLGIEVDELDQMTSPSSGRS